MVAASRQPFDFCSPRRPHLAIRADAVRPIEPSLSSDVACDRSFVAVSRNRLIRRWDQSRMVGFPVPS